jgi:hypothetical protein
MRAAASLGGTPFALVPGAISAELMPLFESMIRSITTDWVSRPIVTQQLDPEQFVYHTDLR